MQRIYARKTTLKKISSEQADEFIKKYHRQGLVTFGKSRYDIGLFYEGELVGSASFSNPRTRAKSREYQQELVRMTFKNKVRVIGGASKLIKYYIDDFKPRNFFTYQTMSGKQSDVYMKSGMSLRSKGKPKQVLVKNGYTYDTALIEYRDKGTKYLFLNAQLVNLGPDNILKTSLGEVFDDKGSRLTNEDLFTKYCDYHAETIEGDNVFDYNNPDYVHYIYSIKSTNPKDKRYYIGRHSIFAPKGMSEDDLLKDNYMGSGGKKFKDWVDEISNDGWSLKKNILEIQTNYSKSIKAEREFIGDLYVNDKNCLNVMPGGLSAHTNGTITYTERFCDIHGMTTFRNKTCAKCSYQKSIRIGECHMHGETLFRGDNCLRCVSLKAIHIDSCDIHGYTNFNGNQCMKCQSESNISYQKCEIHGMAKHTRNTCLKCASKKSISRKVCPIHGLTKHRGDLCMACQIIENGKTNTQICDKHGKTTHRGDACLRCVSEKRHSIDICDVHGETTFSGDKCVSCIRENSIYEDICKIHGKTSFRGGKCNKCITANSITIKHCNIHGMVKHQGDACLSCKNQGAISKRWCEFCKKETSFNGETCMSCVNKSLYSMKECPVHGKTKHRGESCMKCAQAKRKRKPKKEKITEYKECSVCNKNARHVNNVCMSCKEQALYRLAVCDIHGETKFRGRKCCKCRSEEMKKRRLAAKNEIKK